MSQEYKCLNCGKPIEKENILFCDHICVDKYRNKNWGSGYTKKETGMPEQYKKPNRKRPIR